MQAKKTVEQDERGGDERSEYTVSGGRRDMYRVFSTDYLRDKKGSIMHTVSEV